MIPNRIPHFPLPSPKRLQAPSDPTKRENELKGKTCKAPFDGQVSLASIFSSSLFRRGFGTFSCAIIQNGQLGLTFQQLDEMARRVARVIASKISLIVPGQKEAPVNLDGDTIIAVASEDANIDERVIALLLAILKLGASYMAFRPSETGELEWKRIIEQTQSLIVIFAEPTLPKFVRKTTVLSPVTRNGKVKVKLPHQVWTIQELWDEAVSLTFEDTNDISVAPLWSKKSIGDRTAGIFNIEEENGKGQRWIRIGHRMVLNRIQWEKTEFPLQEHEKCYLTYPLTDPRSIFQIFLPLCLGRSLTLLDSSVLGFPSVLLAQIVQEKLFRLNLTPRQLEMLLDVVESTDNPSDLASVRFWMVSGDPFPFHVGRKFFKVYPKNTKRLLIVFYGCPEILWAATWCAFSSLKELKKHSDHGRMCVGVPLHNTSVHIRDDKNCEECPLGDKGEIRILGGTVTVSKNGEEIKEKRELGFPTGDLGRIIEHRGTKLLVVEGRTSTRMKIDQRIIDFVELGSSITDANIVDKCAIFSTPRTKDIPTIVAAYVPKSMSPEDPNYLSSSEIFNKFRSFEPSIAASIIINEIPIRLEDGKIEFRDLRREFHKYLTAGSLGAWVSLKPFRKEKKLAAKALFKAVASSLGIQVQFVCDHLMNSFWSMGGTATQAVRTIIAAGAQGYLLTPEDFVISGRLDTLIDRMILAHAKDPIWERSVNEVKSKVLYEEFAARHRKGVMKILKNDYIMNTPGKPVRLDRYWAQVLDEIVYNNLSVVAILEDQVIGVGLNCKKNPKVTGISTDLTQVLGLITGITTKCKIEVDTIAVGKVAKSYYFAVDEALLSPAQKILVIRDLLNQSHINICSKGYGAFLLCTASPLIQEIAICLLNFKTLIEVPINNYKTTKANNLQLTFWDKDDHHRIGAYIKTKGNETDKGMMSRSGSKPKISKDSSKSNIN